MVGQLVEELFLRPPYEFVSNKMHAKGIQCFYLLKFTYVENLSKYIRAYIFFSETKDILIDYVRFLGIFNLLFLEQKNSLKRLISFFVSFQNLKS